MIDPTSEEGSPPPTEEPADEGTRVPSWSMKDAPSEDVAEHAPSAFVEEPDYQQSVVESLGVPKWSLKDDPEETPAPKPRKEPTHQESKPPILLGVEDKEPQTPVSIDEPGLVDSSPILEDDLVELEPEENPEHSMLDAIPLEEIIREEESPELLIMIDEDAFADVPELGQDVAPLPREEPSPRRIQTESDAADQVAPDTEVTEVVESDAPTFEPEPTFEAEPRFEDQEVLAEASVPPMSIEEDDDNEDVEFDFEPAAAASEASTSERSQVVAPSTPVEPRAHVSTPTSKVSGVVAETPSPTRAKVPAAKRTKKPEPEAPERKAPPEPTPPTRPARFAPKQAAGDRDGEVTASPTPQHGRGALHEDVGGAEVRLLRDVKLHFNVRDWAGAVPLLEQLVKLSPGNALYRGMLGRAMANRPQLRNNAEKHFVEALRLSPQNPELHYWLGLYYKSFGLESRAFNEFRTTLRIKPQHAGAKKQMGAAGKRGAGGGMLKKLFG